MPEEAMESPAEEQQDTSQPTDEAPEGTPSEEPAAEPSHDWEQRYNDLRPEYDRSQQLLSALQGRHGPEAQVEAAKMFGFEFADDDEEPQDDEYVDPTERKLTELEQKLAEREQREQAQAEEALEQEWLKENVDALLKRENTTLTDNERALLVSHACSNRFDDGQPDIEGALKLLNGASEAARERYLQSKKASQVPAGSAGRKTYDLSDDDQRLQALEEEMARARAAEES